MFLKMTFFLSFQSPRSSRSYLETKVCLMKWEQRRFKEQNDFNFNGSSSSSRSSHRDQSSEVHPQLFVLFFQSQVSSLLCERAAIIWLISDVICVPFMLLSIISVHDPCMNSFHWSFSQLFIHTSLHPKITEKILTFKNTTEMLFILFSNLLLLMFLFIETHLFPVQFNFYCKYLEFSSLGISIFK